MTHYLTHLDNFPVERLPEKNYGDFLPKLDHRSLLGFEEVRDYLERCKEPLKKAIYHPYTAKDVHKLRSRMIDQLIHCLFQQFFHNENEDLTSQVSVIAVGGYGRQEMSLFSDVDLLFLYEETDIEKLTPLIEKVLYLLWDIKLDVGYAVRTIDECQELIKEDHTVLTNLIESRYLVGNTQLFEKLAQTIQKHLSQESFRLKFIRDKLDERDERHKKYGGSVYLLKPNLKEGKGGLRDLHLIRWLAASLGLQPSFRALFKAHFITKEEYSVLDFSLRFLLQVRNRLHLLQKKKMDQLQFEYQETLAQSMNFKDSDSGILAVEYFMQCYYTVASQVKSLSHTIIRKILQSQQSSFDQFLNKFKSKTLDEHFKIHEGQIQTRQSDIFEKDPYQLMVLFYHVQETGLEIHFETKELVSRYLYLVNDDFRHNDKISTLFRQMMANFKNLGKALFAMHELHFFDTYIPEFRKLRNRVQHDIYHVYTVDTHSIFAISELSQLESGDYHDKFDLYFEAMKSVKSPELLSMGLLFHDIGKGEGGNHSVIGARIAKNVAKRLNYSEEEQNTIEFLVLSHLLMPHLSQRRDLEDQHLIHEFAKTVGSIDRLNMLFVLTWGDIRAVSSESWTDWKGSLLTRLYEKTITHFKTENLSEDYAMQRTADIRQSILNRIKDDIDKEKFECFLQNISPRYIIAHDEEEIYEHFDLISHHEDDEFIFQDKELGDANVTEILIYTFNNPRVLALVTGVMLAHGVNILAMEIFTHSDGYIFVKLRGQTENKISLEKAELIQKIKTGLKDVFTGKTNVNDLIAKRKKPSYLLPQQPISKASSNVVIDNDVSPYFTIIDVYTHDRLGLLYDIINCLTQQSCYVEVSKISTKVDQVVDSFYVKDIFGHKITSKNKLREIKNALLNVVEPEKEVLEI